MDGWNINADHSAWVTQSVMADYPNSESSPLFHHTRPLNRRNSGKTGSPKTVPTLSLEGEILRLKEELCKSQEQLSDSQAEVSHLEREVTRLKEHISDQDELNNVMQQKADNAKRRSDKALEEADQRIAALKKELAETRASLQEVKERLLGTGESGQVLLMGLPHYDNDQSITEYSPILAEAQDPLVPCQPIKDEPEEMIHDDADQDSSSQVAVKTENSEFPGMLANVDVITEKVDRENLESPSWSLQCGSQMAVNQEQYIAPQMTHQQISNNDNSLCSSSTQSQSISEAPIHMKASQEKINLFTCKTKSSRSRESLYKQAHSWKPGEYKLVAVRGYCCLVRNKFSPINLQEFYNPLSENHAHTRFSCKKCVPTLVMYYKMEIEDHIWVNHTGENFWCPLCRKPYSARTSFLYHAKISHKGLTSKEFRKEAQRQHGKIYTYEEINLKRAKNS